MRGRRARGVPTREPRLPLALDHAEPGLGPHPTEVGVGPGLRGIVVVEDRRPVGVEHVLFQHHVALFASGPAERLGGVPKESDLGKCTAMLSG